MNVNIVRYFAFVMLPVLLSGCYTYDQFFKVTGDIVAEDGMPIDGCTVALKLEGEEGVPWGISPWKSDSHFKAGFVAPFGRNERYYLEITCEGYPEPYKTKTFAATTAIAKYPEPHEFGIIKMKKIS